MVARLMRTTRWRGLVLSAACLTAITGCSSVGMPAHPMPAATTAPTFAPPREGNTIRYAKDLTLPTAAGKPTVQWQSAPIIIGSDEVVAGVAFVYELGGNVQVSNMQAIPISTDEGVVLNVKFDATSTRLNSTLQVFDASVSIKPKSEVPDEPPA